MPFWVYLLKCSDGSYYVGHTDDLEARLDQHHAGQCDGYTKHRRPVQLVYSACFPTRDEALSAERQIKGWSRGKKEALINGDWERIRKLAKSSVHPLTSSG